jgi:hypothetical protein
MVMMVTMVTAYPDSAHVLPVLTGRKGATVFVEEHTQTESSEHGKATFSCENSGT